ncbi:unnamed protein product [Parnassius apollo]|uniref:(apollo) hypothetical protein n=1 Tax=Parnassius apollo TaxID=110799 RepID=A0A8S3WWE4_PARAO|nr:unnamed protein product [Parnassius apollo]
MKSSYAQRKVSQSIQLKHNYIEQIMQMKTNHSSCQQHNIRLENLKIQRIFKNYWLLYTTKDLIISEHCPEHVQKHQVQGTYIMIPNQECRTQVGDTFINAPRYFANIKLQFHTIEITTVREDDIKKEAKQLDLRNVDFSDITNKQC